MGRMVVIDSERFKRALSIRGLQPVDVSDALGYDRNYITKSLREGRISSVAVTGLNNLFNIKAEDIIKPEAKKATAEAEPISTATEAKVNIDYSKLCQCIYKAVLEAIKQVERERGKK